MITLATPFDPGDIDPGQSYTKALITVQKVFPTQSELVLCLEYGNGTSSSDFVAGKAPPVEIIVRNGITGDHYDVLVGGSYPTSTAERLYDGVARVLYQFCIDNVPAFAGGTVT